MQLDIAGYIYTTLLFNQLQNMKPIEAFTLKLELHEIT